jgi:Bacterial SH3 domain
MLARARGLTHGGIPRVPLVIALRGGIPRVPPVVALAAAALALVSACAGVPSTPSSTASRAPTPTAVTVPTPSPTPQLVGTTRTVLSPLGLRIHSAPVLDSKNVLGGFSQGRTFTVLDYQSGGGGWFRVQGKTLTGWVVADPSLTAAGTFNQYAEANGVTALYPQTWGFQQESFGALFVPQQGATQSAVLETGNSLRSFGAAGLAGYTQSSVGPVLVCGYTGTLAYYVKAASYTGATPAPLPVARQPLYAEIRLTIDSTHAVLIGFNYENSTQLDVFSALYNSVAFPFPLCEKTAAATPPP